MFNKRISSFEWRELQERLSKIEEKVFKKTKRLTATRSQKIMIFKHLGLLERIEDLKLSQNQKAEILSILLDADADNIEGDLSQVHRKESALKSIYNFTFLVKFYEKFNLEKFAKSAERELINLKTQEEEEKN